MNAEQKLIARKMMQLRILQAKGTEYQRLFEKVMAYSDPRFTPIKPYGNIGDRKNDGYIRNQGLYFQVYAPERPETARSAVSAASKAAEDFAGLKEAWDDDTPIKEFRFAFNDSYRGSPPPLEEALGKIRKENEIEASVFLAKDLEDRALELGEDQLSDIIGMVVPERHLFDSVDFGVLSEVVTHVMQTPIPLNNDSLLIAPDFEDKIAFNGLSLQVASLLRVGSFQSEAVTDYFSLNSKHARQALRDQLNALYASSREAISQLSPSGEDGDLIFFDLLESMMPTVADSSTQAQAVLQEASIVVMAFYFEACDVFEGPNAAS